MVVHCDPVLVTFGGQGHRHKIHGHRRGKISQEENIFHCACTLRSETKAWLAKSKPEFRTANK